MTRPGKEPAWNFEAYNTMHEPYLPPRNYNRRNTNASFPYISHQPPYVARNAYGEGSSYINQQPPHLARNAYGEEPSYVTQQRMYSNPAPFNATSHFIGNAGSYYDGNANQPNYWPEARNSHYENFLQQYTQATPTIYSNQCTEASPRQNYYESTASQNERCCVYCDLLAWHAQDTESQWRDETTSEHPQVVSIRYVPGIECVDAAAGPPHQASVADGVPTSDESAESSIDIDLKSARGRQLNAILDIDAQFDDVWNALMRRDDAMRRRDDALWKAIRKLENAVHKLVMHGDKSVSCEMCN